MSIEHAVAQAGDDRPDEEQNDGCLEEALPAVLVAELAPKGVETVVARRYEVTTHARCDPPCRSATIVGSAVDDDRLVERREQHADHQRADDDDHPPVIEPERRLPRCGR